jgi:hypothetical protein
LVEGGYQIFDDFLSKNVRIGEIVNCSGIEQPYKTLATSTARSFSQVSTQERDRDCHKRGNERSPG